MVADFEISYYRENINTTGDARQCELRVAIIAIITDGDQDSAFPLPDYAQVYNKNIDRQTDKHILLYIYTSYEQG